METLRYGSSKLVTVALLCGLSAAFFLAIYLNPEWVAGSRKGRFFATGFGHDVVIPLLWIACTVGATRAMMILVGNRVAVDPTGDALVLKTWWRTRHIPWADVGDASIQLTGKGNAEAWQLVILHRSGSGTSEFKLPLATTELHRNRYGEFVEALLAAKARGGAGGVSRSRMVEPEPSGFDADAALARYLAKKEAGLLEAPGGPVAAQRPVFGRKVV